MTQKDTDSTEGTQKEMDGKTTRPASGLHGGLTYRIIGAAHRVYEKLGAGFSREIYENALAYELTERNSRVLRSYPIAVKYGEAVVGEWRADLLVDESVIIVITADRTLDGVRETTLLSVLKCSKFEVGVVVNFGESVEVRRKVCGKPERIRSASLNPTR